LAQASGAHCANRRFIVHPASGSFSMSCGTPVYLHVYDLFSERFNDIQYAILQHAEFHAAVEVYGREFFYGGADLPGSGLCEGKPGQAEGYAGHRARLALGRTLLSEEEVEDLLRKMGEDWQFRDYNLLSKNCCTFAREFLQELGVESMPGWVDRASRRGLEALTSTGVQAAGNVGMQVATTCSTRAIAGAALPAVAGPAGWAALGGELVGGRVGGLVGENVNGKIGKRVGEKVGSVSGAVGAGAIVGAAVGGPVGAGIGAGLGCASYALGTAVTWAVQQCDPNSCATRVVSKSALASGGSRGRLPHSTSSKLSL